MRFFARRDLYLDKLIDREFLPGLRIRGWPVSGLPDPAQPGRHPLKPTLKGYFYTNLSGTLSKKISVGLYVPLLG
jgi:hypothetical protein